MERTIEQIREALSGLDDSSILSTLPLMRKMAVLLGEKSSASVMFVELCREGVKRGILE
ncbi:hypothetical protein CB7_148 [Pectobacterium phage vB_PatM_CB7]|uniref:Uncharacterized protein n=1 Tax=Pectobacterium phage phiTE TaxID=1116482 RepID=K9L498_9CAUD|nr:hypothetical protein [Pectobacterium atrosepticum]YP_007392564.1 hypothetical protein phiTE_102 [Pectobacterium phage phiTE]AEZ66268.1 hypothetical protein phiTE_102 [Pectobacterium phage phiTE]ARB11622.1 hypothetical protein CB7_148 [Pectobacterium phage vB_PatM_CB7]